MTNEPIRPRTVARVRRREQDARVLTEWFDGQDWTPWEDVADPLGVPGGIARREPDPAGFVAGDGLLLPFAPQSFRDFMLYEDHVIAASRHMARRYLPGPYRVASLFERVTGRTFPRFRPNKLWYEQPIYYMSNPLTFVPSGGAVGVPAYADALDFELELGAVLARPLRDASPEEAAGAIGGYVVLNDFSARNLQIAEMRSGFGPQKAKHFLSSMSTDLIAASQVLDPTALNAIAIVNGQTVADTSLAGPQFTLPEAIAFASRGEQLYPGELFGTGTVPGCSGIEANALLSPGDHLELRIDGVGTIIHDIVEYDRKPGATQ